MAVRSTNPTRDGDGLMILTAAHVCGSLSPAGPGEHEVLFSSGVGPSQEQGRPLGRVVRSVPPHPTDEILVDAALIAPRAGLELAERIGDGVRPAGVRDLLTEDPDDYVRVHKDGRITGRTHGWLDPAAVTLTTASEREYGNAWWIEGDDGKFADIGDSGSMVLDDEGYVVGMAVAINQPEADEPPLTLCQAIVPLLEALEIELP